MMDYTSVPSFLGGSGLPRWRDASAAQRGDLSHGQYRQQRHGIGNGSVPGVSPGFMPGVSPEQRQQSLPYQGLPFWQALQGQQTQAFQTPQMGFIPSMQRWNRLAPSEQQGFLGIAQSEFGLDANDVMAQTQRLAPRGAGAFSYAPKFLRY